MFIYLKALIAKYKSMESVSLVSSSLNHSLKASKAEASSRILSKLLDQVIHPSMKSVKELCYSCIAHIGMT